MKQKRTRRKISVNKVIAQYVASFFAVFLLPMLLLQQALYPRLTALMRQREIDLEGARLDVVAENLSGRLRLLYGYANIFYSSSDIVSYVVSEDTPINRLKIINELKTSFIANDYNAVFFYNPAAERLYTTSLSYRAEWLNNSKKDPLFVPALPGDALFEHIRAGKGLSFLGSQTVYLSGIARDRCVFSLPVTGNYGYLIFVMDADALLQMRAGDETARLLLSGAGETLASCSFLPALPAGALRARAVTEALGGAQYAAIPLNGAEYTACARDLSDYGMRLISLTPNAALLGRVSELQSWYTVRIALISLLGALLALAFSHLTYRPVLTVRRRAANVNLAPRTGEEAGAGSDFDFILSAIDNMETEYSQMRQNLAAITGNSRQYFLFRYLYDGFDSEKEIVELARLYDIDLRDQMVCVAFSIPAAPESRERAQSLLREMLKIPQTNPGAASCYLLNGSNYANLFMVLFFDAEEDLKQYYYLLYSLPEGAKAGIGTYQSVSEPGKSRSISMAALEAALLDDKLQFAASDDVSVQEADIFRALYDNLQGMEVAIMRGEREQVIAAFNTLMNITFEQTKSLHVIQTAYLNIYNTIVRAYNLLRSEHNLQLSAMNYLYCDYDVPRPIPEMRLNLETIRNQILAILERFGQGDEAAAALRIQEVLKYIDQNYADSALTLSSVSERFGFTYSNFSHYFRGRTGVTFSGYLEKLRIRHARELLLNTALTIDQIAAAVGYTNANTFTRSFKKHENLSPGSFRKGTKQ